MKFDYNHFTKTELVAFLNRHGDEFRYTTKPYLIIIEERQNKLYKELELLQKDNERLLVEMRDLKEKADIVRFLNKSKEMDKNHKKWEKIHQELDKISEMLVGD